MYVLQIGMDKRFGVQYLILDLKTLSDSEDFMFSGINSAPRFIMDSVPKKTVLSFCLVYGHHFWVHRQGFPKILKISFFIVGDYYYYPFYYPSLLLPFLTLYISISKYCKFFWCIETDLSIFKNSEKLVLWSPYTILNALSWNLFIFLFNFLL